MEQDSQFFLIEAFPGTPQHFNVLNSMRFTYLDPHFSTRWQPCQIQMVYNATLIQDYMAKFCDLLRRGSKGPAVTEQFGFLVVNKFATMKQMCESGLKVRESVYNVLGSAKHGVYLCKHADVVIKYTFARQSNLSFMRILVVKYMTGRFRKVTPQRGKTEPPYEPSPEYDSYVAYPKPNYTENVMMQFDLSQVYLFEFDANGKVSDRPRNIVPYAIVTLTEDGKPWGKGAHASIPASMPVEGSDNSMQADGSESAPAEGEHEHGHQAHQHQQQPKRAMSAHGPPPYHMYPRPPMPFAPPMRAPFASPVPFGGAPSAMASASTSDPELVPMTAMNPWPMLPPGADTSALQTAGVSGPVPGTGLVYKLPNYQLFGFGCPSQVGPGTVPLGNQPGPPNPGGFQNFGDNRVRADYSRPGLTKRPKVDSISSTVPPPPPPMW